MVVVSIFIATFILFIDSYMVMRSGWHLSGIQELKRGGWDISGGMTVRIKAGYFSPWSNWPAVGGDSAQLTASVRGVAHLR